MKPHSRFHCGHLIPCEVTVDRPAGKPVFALSKCHGSTAVLNLSATVADHHVHARSHAPRVYNDFPWHRPHRGPPVCGGRSVCLCRTGLGGTYSKVSHFAPRSRINVGGGSFCHVSSFSLSRSPSQVKQEPPPIVLWSAAAIQGCLPLPHLACFRPSPLSKSKKTTPTFRHPRLATLSKQRGNDPIKLLLEEMPLRLPWRWGGGCCADGDAGISHLSECRFGWFGSQAALSRSDRSHSGGGGWHFVGVLPRERNLSPARNPVFF